MKNKFLILAILLFSVSSLFAVPAVPCAIEKVQPDGTIISVYLKGDEKVSWMESEDGYTLMYDSLKYVVYAQIDGQGNLTPSNIKFGSGARSATNIAKGLRYSKAQVNTLMQIWEMTDSAVVQRGPTGNVNMLCILASFSDRALVKTQAEFDNLMNQVGYNTGGAQGSVKDYYLESSYGLLNLQVTVIGPVILSHTSAYCAQNHSAFANEVVNLADPLVDFSQFATNGQVPTFHIIFAGYGAEATGDRDNQIWSYSSSIYITKQGIQLSRYSCSPELLGYSGTNITNIGVIAHEMGHGLGSDDYYDASSNYGGDDFIGAGKWCLMAGGSWNGGSTLNDKGRQPASINPYQKIQFGWVTPQILTTGSSVSNMPPSANNSVVYKIAANTTDGEHYLLENRQYVGFDASLPGHGLLIWHIAANITSFPNDNHPLQVYPVCASSTTAIPTNTPSSYGVINSAGCPFPGTSGKTEFTDNSTPRAFTWTGLGGIGIPIRNITENVNQTVSFCMAPVNLPLTGTVNGSNVYQATQQITSNQIINSGYTIYKAPEVELGSGFEVKLGAEFEIRNDGGCP